MIRTVAALAGLALLTGLLSPVSARASVAAQERQQERTWLALGDSYSSGEGIKETPATYSPTLGRDCRRATGEDTSAIAWAPEAHKLAGDDLGLRKPDFVACTGAITDEAPWQIHEARTREGSPDRWDLVTFSFGGNNIKFSEVIKGCLGLRVKSWTSFKDGCVENEDQLRHRVDMLVGKRRIDSGEYAGWVTVPTLFDLVADNVAPGGDVIVAGYPNLIEEYQRWSRTRRYTTGICSGILGADVPMLRDVGAYLNQRIADAVEAANARHRDRQVTFHFLDIARNPYESGDDSADRHGRCTDDPWLNGVTLGNHEGEKTYTLRSFHPNQKGHAATGQVLADYLRDNVRFDDTTKPVGKNAIGEAFLGSWRSSAPADQPTSDKTYWVEITLREGSVRAEVGDIGYPGLDCTGSLTLVEATSDRLVLTERIQEQPRHPCVERGTVTLVRTGTGLDFSYERESEPGDVAVTAKLTKR
ncbi:hypothetical protein [Actinophytocola sp.]|uniref:hypothetical protein n=1 Tax=Actinophytocola sp. TaxID=1872138 RepID=UPI003D6A7C2A